MFMRHACRAQVVVGLVLVLAGCSGRAPEPATPAVDPAFVEAARAASNRLRVNLQQELRAAMEAGGPTAAIDVCRTRATEIATEVSADTGREVRRVATRHRNPDNAADAVEQAVLAVFAARPELADTAFVRDDAPVYMRAIRIESAGCLACHGPAESLAPDLQAALARHYPDDRATGFAEGDLRGAFVVR